jgi:RNA polymerase sigma-70 factor (ECF subfamily)
VPLDDRDLVRRCLAREERAYREMVRRYQGAVVNLAWRITGNADDAAEVAQETFIRVLRSLQSYDPTRPFRSWLFKIASNLALDTIEPADLGPGPEEGLRIERSEGRFDALVAELPQQYQAILFLRYREEFSYDEIAETLGLPLGTVKVRIHRAHEFLRRKLMARGKTP